MSETVKMNTKKELEFCCVTRWSWEITYDDFTEQVSQLTRKYCEDSTIFPKHKEPEYNETLSGKDHNFLRKIEEIDYFKEKWVGAIRDFYRTSYTISKEWWDKGTHPRDYEAYQAEVEGDFSSKYNIHKLSPNNAKDLITESKLLYEEVTGCSYVKPYLYFNDTPSYFRNGILHILLDNRDDLAWKIQ